MGSLPVASAAPLFRDGPPEVAPAQDHPPPTGHPLSLKAAQLVTACRELAAAKARARELVRVMGVLRKRLESATDEQEEVQESIPVFEASVDDIASALRDEIDREVPR